MKNNVEQKILTDLAICLLGKKYNFYPYVNKVHDGFYIGIHDGKNVIKETRYNFFCIYYLTREKMQTIQLIIKHILNDCCDDSCQVPSHYDVLRSYFSDAQNKLDEIIMDKALR